MSKLLVIGARAGSLGMAVANTGRMLGYDVVTAGIEDEDEHCDITVWQDRAALKLHRFDSVVCTVGVNEESVPGSLPFARSLSNQIATNAIAPLTLLDEWYGALSSIAPDGQFNFVAISSNSARIPRSNSVGYCASKAALSMGIQSFGRSIASDKRFAVWCYEPAWIPDTPMSKEVTTRLEEEVVTVNAKQVVPRLHRVPGDRLMTAEEWAIRIVRDIRGSAGTLNGCAIRLDAEL